MVDGQETPPRLRRERTGFAARVRELLLTPVSVPRRWSLRGFLVASLAVGAVAGTVARQVHQTMALRAEQKLEPARRAVARAFGEADGTQPRVWRLQGLWVQVGALCEEDESRRAHVLERLGLSPDDIRSQTLAIVREGWARIREDDSVYDVAWEFRQIDAVLQKAGLRRDDVPLDEGEIRAAMLQGARRCRLLAEANPKTADSFLRAMDQNLTAGGWTRADLGDVDVCARPTD